MLGSYGRSLIAAADNTAARSALGLGTAATYNVGIDGAAIPLLDAATNTFSGNVVSTTSLRVDTSVVGGIANLFLIAPAGESANIRVRSGAGVRWTFGKNTDAETGSNSGGNFVVTAWNDLNNPIAAALTITRSTLIANFAVSPTAPTPAAADSSTKLATTAYVQGEFTVFRTTPTTFTAQQIISISQAGIPLILVSTSDATGAGPSLDLRRDSPGPAANDNLGEIRFFGRSSTAVNRAFGEITNVMLNPADGAEAGSMRLRVMSGGAVSSVMTLQTGVQVGLPTGGDKGLGSLNAKALYDDEAVITCLPMQRDFLAHKQIDLGKWDGLAPDGHHKTAHAFAKMVAGGFDPRDPAAYIRKALEDAAIPGMPTLDEWEHNSISSGEMFTKLWLAVEMLAVAWMHDYESRTVH